MGENETAARIEAIRERLRWMRENMSGCDWCCGGGDEEWDHLVEELQRLGGQFPSGPVQSEV
jgi:hypothetical protein